MNTQEIPEVTALANQMGVSAADLSSFLVCISHHMAKGLDLPQAMAKHEGIMRGMCNRMTKMTREQVAAQVTAAFFPA